MQKGQFLHIGLLSFGYICNCKPIKTNTMKTTDCNSPPCALENDNTHTNNKSYIHQNIILTL